MQKINYLTIRWAASFFLACFVMLGHAYPGGSEPGDENWSVVGEPYGPQSGAVLALAVYGNNLYVAGTFADIGEFSDISYLAKWDGTAWSAIGTGVNGVVKALAVDTNGNLYVGGSFTSAGGVANTKSIAKWNGTSWSALGTGMTQYYSVNALVLDSSGNLYAGGSFISAGGVAGTGSLAKWNGTTWSPLGAGVGGEAHALIFDSQNNLYAAGIWANGVPGTNYIAKWNGTVWSPLGTGSDDYDISSLAIDSDDNLYVGGWFYSMSGVPNTKYIAKWNGANWSSLAADVDNDITALMVDGTDTLYVGGYFTSVNSVTANYIAKWNGTAWAALGSGYMDVMSFARNEAGEIYVGGSGGGGLAKWTVVDTDGDNFQDYEDAFPDDPTEGADPDMDGIGSNQDNCPLVDNYGQEDLDLDGIGDDCDDDMDGDGLSNAAEDLLGTYSDQPDSDGDELLDGYEVNTSLTDPLNGDTDNDDLSDYEEIYTKLTNPLDADSDDDTYNDGTDPFPLDPTEWLDTDQDGVGNNTDTDDDGDALSDLADNCPVDYNPNQLDTDTDEQGDLCDLDDDADGLLDVSDNCPLINNVDQIDSDNDTQGDVCDAQPYIASAGSLDTSFNPGSGASNGVWATCTETDGKIIIGGYFTNVNGITQNRIARLHVDGLLDGSFNPGSGANSDVWASAVQADGKIIIGGYFTSINGSARIRIARMNTDGSLDSSFDPGTGANNTIFTIAVQADGKILIGGAFTAFNGIARNRIARLNANGSLDNSFNPGTGANSDIYTAAVQADGKIIISGTFNGVNGTAIKYIARLNADGSLDPGFNSGIGPSSHIWTTIVQLNGKIIIGGRFSSVNGISRNRIARLNTDGSLDTSFNPGSGASSDVNISAVQTDGKIIIGGRFITVNGISKNRIARLNADGSLDTIFNTGSGVNDFIRTVSIQADGRIVIGGFFSSVNGIARNSIARIHTGNTDGDAIEDGADNCINTVNDSQLNTDGDTQGNACDSDDDNDTILDINDAFPLDATESVDTDSDGTGNNADTDDDNDSVADTADAFSLDANRWQRIRHNVDFDNDSDILIRSTSTGAWTSYGIESGAVIDFASFNIPTSSDTQYIAQLDANGDGDADVLTRSVSTGAWTLHQVQNGAVISSAPLYLYANLDWKFVGVGDLNGDGTDDVLLRSTSQSYYNSFLINNHTVATVHSYNAWPDASSIDQGIGDFDGDGTDDLLVRRTSDNLYFIFKSVNGLVDSSYCACNIWHNPDWTFQFAGDTNKDGIDDIVIRATGATGDGFWWAFRMNNFSSAQVTNLNLFNNKTRVSFGAAGDYNGDGTIDVLTRVDGATTYVTPLNNGLITTNNWLQNFTVDQTLQK